MRQDDPVPSSPHHVLFVGDQLSIESSFEPLSGLDPHRFQVEIVADSQGVETALHTHQADVVVCKMAHTLSQSHASLNRIKALSSSVPVIFLAESYSLKEVVALMQAGAFAVVAADDPSTLHEQIRQALSAPQGMVQREAESRLRASEYRYRQMFEAHGLPKLIVDPQTGDVVDANSAAQVYYGMPHPRIAGWSVMDITADDAQTLLSHFQQVLSGGMNTVQTVHRVDGGQYRAVQCYHNLIGEPDAPQIYCIVTDIHEQEEAKAQLEAAQYQLEQRVQERTAELTRVKDRIEAIFNHSGDGILLMNLDFGIQQVNYAFEMMAGVRQDQCVGHTLGRYFKTNDGRTFEIMMHEVASTHRTRRVEGRLRHISGDTVDVEISIAPVNRSSRAVTNLVCIVRDITERKQAENALLMALDKERELGELKSRFVSMASHEFRTPLASILAVTETLTRYRERMDNPMIDERLNRIRGQINYMKGLMEDVLVLARIQAGRVDFAPVRGDLQVLVAQMIEEFDALEPQKGRIIVEYEDSSVFVDYDDRWMRQLMNNLISNALKYSLDGKPIHVRLSQDDASVTLRVQDQGIGIPPEDLKHLFEPFHRAKNVGTISGTGIGMSIVKQAVDLHGGLIDFESALNVGTTFTVTLPKECVKDRGDGQNSGD